MTNEQGKMPLPVLGSEGKPVGLITSMDVGAALVNAIDEREAMSM